MDASEFDELPRSEKKHFQVCKYCSEYYDSRSLEEVSFHYLTGHRHRRDLGARRRRRLTNTQRHLEICRLNEEIPSPENLRPLPRLKAGLRVFLEVSEDFPQKGWGVLQQINGVWTVALDSGIHYAASTDELLTLLSVE